jgi:hypothetical protein
MVPGVGYIFTGVGADTFIHTGAKGVSNGADSGRVRIEFPATADAGGPVVVYDTNLTGRISLPINGVTPVRNIVGNQYTGIVTWAPAHSAFQLGVSYTAVLTLNAAPGYTFAGIGQNAFTHDDAPGAVINAAGSGAVTIVFSPAASSANPAMRFGPVTDGDSALWLMKEKKDYIYSLYIDLPAGTEDIDEGVTLVASDNSPANVIIDGHGRVLRIEDSVLLTVSGNVTLTLKNITLQGKNGNPTPLFKVWPGGKLILGEGAALVGNKSSGDAGGVWVNGGTFVMNAGAEIKGMQARRGGGVFIDADGKFFMKGGTIGGVDPEDDGNRALEKDAGGGVLIVQGIFDMDGGVIQSNAAASAYSGAGVGVLAKGTFNQYSGIITKNTAAGENSGGGLFTAGSFTMKTSAAVIKENIAEAVHSGGGIYVDDGVFTMANGTVQANTAKGANSGGGLFVEQRNFSYVLPIISGGTIEQNVALGDDSGGGICIGHIGIGAFNIFAGSIKENTARGLSSGGGVYVAVDGKVQMTGAAAFIESNIAEGANSGGGVYVSANGLIGINSGVVRNNEAREKQSGGGIYVSGGSSSSNGVIKGNKASYSGPGSAADFGSGGGVYFAGESFSNSGTIGGTAPGDANIALIGANGVYIAGGLSSSDLSNSGEITGNTAVNTNNYGVYIKSGKVFTLSGSGRVYENTVFLCSGTTIRIDVAVGVYLTSLEPVANIICEAPPVSYNGNPNPDQATRLLSAYNSNFINNNKHLFLYNGAPVSITDAIAIQDGSYYYGYYNE